MKKMLVLLMACLMIVFFAVPAFAATEYLNITLDDVKTQNKGAIDNLQMPDSKSTTKYFTMTREAAEYLLTSGTTVCINMGDATVSFSPSIFTKTATWQSYLSFGEPMGFRLIVDIKSLTDETTYFKDTTFNSQGLYRCDNSNFEVGGEILVAGVTKAALTEFAGNITYVANYEWTNNYAGLSASTLRYYWLDKAKALATNKNDWQLVGGTVKTSGSKTGSITFSSDLTGLFMVIADKSLASSGGTGTTTPSTASGVFKDISAHWAVYEITYFYNLGIINDEGDYFYPKNNMTRGQFAEYLVRTLGLAEDLSATGQFKDVPASSPYYVAIHTAFASGIVKGTEADKYSPNVFITREQMAVMMIRALTGLNKSIDTNTAIFSKYTDADKISSWAKQDMAASVNAGLLSGRTLTELEPKANVTKAETIVILNRLYNLIN